MVNPLRPIAVISYTNNHIMNKTYTLILAAMLAGSAAFAQESEKITEEKTGI